MMKVKPEYEYKELM